MHMFSKAQEFYGGHGIVGGQVPLGTGLALCQPVPRRWARDAHLFRRRRREPGPVFEAFNMAALWKLPVVYVIENNQYAMGTSLARSSAETHLFKRGASFNIPGKQVDGMDVVAVREAGMEAVEFARAGNGRSSSK